VFCHIVSGAIKTNSLSQAKRSPEEEGDFMAFEQLVAEAAIKKEKKKGDKNKDKKTTESGGIPETQFTAEAAAADAPNVPRAKS